MAGNREFRCANHSRLLVCGLSLVLSGCSWHGIRPVYQRINLADQAQRAEAVVFGQTIQSRSLHHKELLPASLRKGFGAEHVRCEAVEKVLKVRQVLKGPIEAGTPLKVDTYEIKGIAQFTAEPAIFFLKREGGAWRPVIDFQNNAISLPGFPNRPLLLSHGEGRTSALDQVLTALLDPRNASDWPQFKDLFARYVHIASNFASASGILASDPGFVIDRLIALMRSSNPRVSAEARKEFLLATGLCHQTGAFADKWRSTLELQHFMESNVYAEPGKSPEERERTYWGLKACSCSKLPQARARANMLLHRYYPDRKTVGCEICAGA